MHKKPPSEVAEKQCLNIPGETNRDHGAQWSLADLQHLRMWPGTVMKYLAKRDT